MSSVARLAHQFVTSAPPDLSPGVLYVSLEYCTMLHLCACGCGRKVVTPLSPNDWSMTFNGKTITVNPSIGSWSLPCQSHYVIKRGKVVWAGQWSDEQIKKGREADLVRKRGHQVVMAEQPQDREVAKEHTCVRPPWPQRFISWLGKKFR